MWRNFLPATVFLALGLVLAYTLTRIDHGKLDVREIESPLLGKPAPAFRLPSLVDPVQTIDSHEFAGRPYVFNVWGTWCGGCREEHAALIAIARTSGVPIVGLDWKDDRALAAQWLNELGNPYLTVASDADGRVAIDWGVYGAPETFLVSASGVVLAKHIGPLSAEVWRRKFAPKLGAGRRNGLMKLRAMLLLGVLACASQSALAIDSGDAFTDPLLQGRYERLIHELRCVQCQNVTIADSNVGLAADLRRQIREMIGAGQSDDQIRLFMTERYGDFVLYDPPLRPRTWILWAAPALLLALAVAVVAVAAVRRSRRPPGEDPDDSLVDGERPV